MLAPFPEFISYHTDGEVEGPGGLNNLPKVQQLVKTWRRDLTQEFSLQSSSHSSQLHYNRETEDCPMRRLTQQETTCPRRPSQRWNPNWGLSLSPLLAQAPAVGCLIIHKTECTARSQNTFHTGMFVASENSQLRGQSAADPPSPGTAWNL